MSIENKNIRMVMTIQHVHILRVQGYLINIYYKLRFVLTGGCPLPYQKRTTRVKTVLHFLALGSMNSYFYMC